MLLCLLQLKKNWMKKLNIWQQGMQHQISGLVPYVEKLIRQSSTLKITLNQII